MTASWYTIQLQPQLLETADFHLRRQNFIPFFPRIEIRKTKKTSVIEPMFKGYGFVFFDPEIDRWLSINGTRGVIGLLPRYALIPQPMPKGMVEYFQENDPMKENEFIDAFENYFPGITEVEVSPEHRLLGGRKGLVVAVRDKLLQVSFAQSGSDNAVWLDRDVLSPVLK